MILILCVDDVMGLCPDPETTTESFNDLKETGFNLAEESAGADGVFHFLGT